MRKRKSFNKRPLIQLLAAVFTNGYLVGFLKVSEESGDGYHSKEPCGRIIL